MRAPRRPGFYREDWSVFDHDGTVLRMGTAPYIAALIVVAGG